MSAAGSPVADGSPTASAAPAVPGIDGAELAFHMVQAAESAAFAATAATQALSSLSSTSGASISSGDWFKVLCRNHQLLILRIERQSCRSSETGGGKWNSTLLQ